MTNKEPIIGIEDKTDKEESKKNPVQHYVKFSFVITYILLLTTVAINNKKCIASELYQNGAANAERFNDFLKKICSKIKGKLFVLDNGQIHKTENTKQIIRDSGNYLLYTVSYHPRLNSIEQFFNQMKHYIKLDKPNTFTALDESVKSSIGKIKQDNYENYFIYAYNKDYYKNKQVGKKYTKRKTLKVYKD